MALSRKSLGQAFRLSGSISSIAWGPVRRTFTSSATRKSLTVPKFTQTSSPELDEILSTLRSNVLMPALLSPAQKKLIYNLKNKEKLENETFTANIGGEEFRLKTIDQTKDIPNSNDAIMKAATLMKDKKDWDNLPLILKGLRIAGRSLKGHRPKQILRKAAKAGRIDVMIECARQVRGTGFVLNNLELVREYMWYIRDKARLSDWDPKETKQALLWTEEIAKVLEETTHVEAAKVSKLQPRKDPLVIGVMLELSAIRVTQITAESEEDKANMIKKVSRFAERFLASELETIRPPTGESERGNTPEATPIQLAHIRNYYLRFLVPIARGIKIAQTIIDPNTTIAASLKAQQSELEKLMATLNSQILVAGLPPTTGGHQSYQEYVAEEI